jgi:hypothetical protein
VIRYRDSDSKRSHDEEDDVLLPSERPKHLTDIDHLPYRLWVNVTEDLALHGREAAKNEVSSISFRHALAERKRLVAGLRKTRCGRRGRTIWIGWRLIVPAVDRSR